MNLLLQLHLIVINSIIQKYYGSELKINPSAEFLKCSYRELIFNQCPQNIYTKLNQSIFYVDLYYIREGFNFNKLTQQQQEFIVMNEFISYYGRAAIIASISHEFLKIQTLYNADTTSIMAHQPSRYQNFTASTYQTCLGTDFIEPYDPRCRSWYKYAKQHEGYFFYEPYLDAIEGNLEMTLSSRIIYNSEFKSVSSIDYEMNSIIDLFKITQSQNAYSVLFHEFNNTIFYHPLLNASDVISWGDLEFQNITENCQGAQALQSCLIEKQIFVQQLNSTVDFIQTQNYSIKQQINIDGLYQRWSRYGVNLISLVFPLLSKITKYKTQQPYSFSIILTARVLEDISDQFILSKLININSIKIPLMIEFILVCLLITLFLIKYGQFLVFQVQRPIDILTLFLKESLILQSQTQTQKQLKKIETFSSKFSEAQKSKLKQNNLSIFYPHQSKSKNNDSLSVSSPYPFDEDTLKQTQAKKYSNYQSKHQIQIKSIVDQKQSYFQETDNQLILLQSKENSFSLKKYEINQASKSVKQSFQKILRDSKAQYQNFQSNCQDKKEDLSQSNIYKSQKSSNRLPYQTQMQIIAQEQFQEKDQNSKILDELVPLFLEMKIIKETFQNLESLINYSIDAQTQNSGDIMNSLFHLAKAKSTFQRLQNQNGLSRCYFNLGIIYLLKKDYEVTQEYFLSAIQLNLSILGIDYKKLKQNKLPLSYDIDSEDHLFILRKRILCLAYSLKQQAFEQIYEKQQFFFCFESNNSNRLFNINKIDQDNHQSLQNILMNSIKNFRILENLMKIPSQNTELFQVFINLEIIEILIHIDHINQIKEIQYYFDKTTILIDQLKSKHNKNMEDDSVKWIYQTQQQILHNSAYSQQLIETYSFNQLQLHLVVINSIIQKYYDSELRINPNAKFLKCSYRELIFNECPEDVYTKLSQSIFYVDLYYIREGFNFNNLTIQQQEFIVMNEFISYYGRAAILASISQELLKIQTLYNADTTSIMAHQPSRYQNFTASTYQTCLGTDFIEPYDPRCRSWYKYANQHEGYFFYEPYLDAIEGNLEMTLSSRIYYKQEFKSVSSIDYEMNSIIEIFKATQSQNAYSVLFHEFNNTIFYHPLLNASDVISWGDLEFQNITTNCIGEQALEQCNLEKQSFAQQLDQTVNFIQTLNYSIEEQINTQGLYQYWSRYGVN
ncbi:hypothetical protein ABPG74_018087, partial [Tetrahymena malaccensis]